MKDPPVMELSAYFHRNYLHALQTRPQWWGSTNMSVQSNASPRQHDPIQPWLNSPSDTCMTGNVRHQRSVCTSSIKNTRVDGECVSDTSSKGKQDASVLRGLLLRCLPTAACSSQKTNMDSFTHSSNVLEGQEEECLPGVLQKRPVGQNQNTHISEQELSQWLGQETGMDRLRMMYSLGQDLAFIHKDTKDLNNMWLATAGVWAGVSFAKAYLQQHSEKKKLLSNMQPVLRESFRKQVNWKKIIVESAKSTLKFTVSTALLFHLSQAIAAYRNKSSVWEYTVSSTLGFGVLGLGYGLKRCARMSLYGAAFGTVGGYIVCKCLVNDGISQEQKHLDWLRHHWREQKVMKQKYE